MYLKTKTSASNNVLKMSEVKNDFLSMLFLFIILCVTLALVHDHYQRGYSGTNRALNASVFIENALKRIPICSADDRSRQRALLYTFQTWTHIAEYYSIPYWISHQTLHSYVQDQNLPAYQSNIDVSILVDDLVKLFPLTQVYLPDDHRFEISQRFFIPLSTAYLRLVNHRMNVSINIWPNDLSNSYRLIEKIRTVHQIFPLEPCVFAGIRVWCPSHPRKLLSTVYRQQKPKEFICFDGKWIS